MITTAPLKFKEKMKWNSDHQSELSPALFPQIPRFAWIISFSIPSFLFVHVYFSSLAFVRLWPRPFVPPFLRFFSPSCHGTIMPSLLLSVVFSFFVPSFFRSLVPFFLRSFVPSFLRCFFAPVLSSFVPFSLVSSFPCFFVPFSPLPSFFLTSYTFRFIFYYLFVCLFRRTSSRVVKQLWKSIQNAQVLYQ